MSGSAHQDSRPFHTAIDGGSDDPPDPYQTRTLNPGDVIEVYHNQDDNETVLTDLQTIEYVVGQRTLFPAAQDMSSSDSDDNKHPTLNPITEEDGRSAATPASNSSYGDSKMPPKTYTSIPPNDKKMMATTNVPDPNWKGQLESEIGALPSRLPSAPPAIGGLQYDDQGRASKEQLKNNPDAVARVGAHAEGGGSTNVADPDWKEDLNAEIQSMPAPIPQQAAAASASNSMLYDNRGRALKARMVQDPAIAGRVGAHAQGGPTSDGEEKNSVGEASVGEEKNSTGDHSNHSDGNNSTQTKPWWKSEPFIVSMGALILIIIAVAVVVPLVLNMGGTEEDPLLGLDNQEGGPLVEDPVEEGFDLSLVPGLSNITILALDEIESAQYKAFDWISQDPNWDMYEDWRKQQRFAMACIHFSFETNRFYSV
jgi:hypothetical protein